MGGRRRRVSVQYIDAVQTVSCRTNIAYMYISDLSLFFFSFLFFYFFLLQLYRLCERAVLSVSGLIQT